MRILRECGRRAESSPLLFLSCQDGGGVEALAGSASRLRKSLAGRPPRVLDGHTEQAGEGGRSGSDGIRNVKAKEAAGYVSTERLLGIGNRVLLLVSGAFGRNEGAKTDTGRLSKAERTRKYGEVFTPDWCVKEMCDMLEEESPGAFEPARTFLEPTCGDGAFVVEILRRKFERCRCRKDYTTSLGSVYGFEIQADNVEECIRRVTELCYRYFKPTKSELQIINDHYIMCDALKIMRMLSEYGKS